MAASTLVAVTTLTLALQPWRSGNGYPNITTRVKQAIADTPVILQVGTRQSDKTTLISQKSLQLKALRHITLDDIEGQKTDLSLLYQW